MLEGLILCLYSFKVLDIMVEYHLQLDKCTLPAYWSNIPRCVANTVCAPAHYDSGQQLDILAAQTQLLAQQYLTSYTVCVTCCTGLNKSS